MTKNDPNALLSALSKLESLRDPKCVSTQRQYNRFVVRGDAVLTPMEPGAFNQEPITVMLRDLGRGGVGFVCNRQLPAFSTWRIHIVNRSFVVAQQAMIVRHAHRVLNDIWLVGAQFCAESGLLSLVGVEPQMIAQGDNPHESSETTFLSPGEVA